MTTAKKSILSKVKSVVAKKAVTKTVAKKVPVRNLKNEKRVLVCASGDQCFWTTDGKIIANLVELRDIFEAMTDEVFAHHVSKSKNDFADWTHYVLGDIDLAKKIRGAKKPSTARTAVVAHLKLYDI